jgi:hypothetical protein
MHLQGRGIDRGCVDSSLSGSLALEAADTITELLEALSQLRSNAEIANRLLPQTDEASIVASALFDTISQADRAIAKARGQQ